MLTKTLSAVLLSLVVLVPTAAAQDCSALDVSFSGTLAAGGTLSLELSGAPANGFTFLFIGDTLGETCFAAAGNLICLGLGLPFLALAPIGLTDANGNISVSVDIPGDASGVGPAVTLHFQAVTFAFAPGQPSWDACASNVSSVDFE